MARVVQFEIQAEDPARAARFYAEALGWKVGPPDETTGRRAILTSDPAGNGTGAVIVPRNTHAPGSIPVISVPSADGYAARVGRNGGKVLTQKLKIPGLGYMIYCQDTEGTTFALLQSDPEVI